jgi:hypothetical protein
VLKTATRCATALVAAAFLCILQLVTAPSASAAPIIPPGIDLGSSGPSLPSTPTPGGYGVYTSVEPDLSGMPVGTTWSSNYLSGDCVTDPRSRGFFWDSGDGNPFRSCFYDPSTALYEYELRTPTDQRARVLVRFTSNLMVYLPGFAGVSASCEGGNSGCTGAIDTRQRITGTVLTPRPKLGPLPKPPADSYVFCASESLVCHAPTGSTIAYGNGDDFTQKVMTGPSLHCTTSEFGGTDPAPGKFKDCFKVG